MRSVCVCRNSPAVLLSEWQEFLPYKWMEELISISPIKSTILCHPNCFGLICLVFFLAVFDYIRKVFFEKSRRIRISQWCNKPPVLSGIKYRTNIVMWRLVSWFFLGFSVCLSTELLVLDRGILPQIRSRVLILSELPALVILTFWKTAQTSFLNISTYLSFTYLVH